MFGSILKIAFEIKKKTLKRCFIIKFFCNPTILIKKELNFFIILKYNTSYISLKYLIIFS